MAGRLAHEIERFLAVHGARPGALAQVCICGGFPDLRSMAMRLTEALDVEVEPLDSLFGIDAAALPGSAREFPEQAVDFRLAWAVATDWPAPINLLRERNRRRTKIVLSRAAVAAGVVTGVAVAWQVQRSDWWRSTPPRPGPAPARAASPAPRTAQTTAPALPVRKPPATRAIPPSAVPVAAPPPSSSPPPSARVLPPPPSLPPPPAPAPAPAPSRAPAPRAAATVPAQMPVVQTPPVRPSPVPARPAPPPPAAQPVARARVQAPQAPEIPLPFDAVLGSILYAPERKLAIVNGRIVEAGDIVNGARVVDITPTAVLLRDAQGRLRRLGLGAPAR